MVFPVVVDAHRKYRHILGLITNGHRTCNSGKPQLRAISMLLILVEVSVKVARQSTTATDCSHRATSMLHILVEVSIEVARRSTTAKDCSHRATSMLLILVEAIVKVACQSTIATEITEISMGYAVYVTDDVFIGIKCIITGLIHYDSHRLQAQSYHHATYYFGGESGSSIIDLHSCNLFRRKYM